MKIGLIPGAGGTQMLLRMIDFATAARMVSTGRPVSAEEGLKLGLLHRIVDGEPLEAAISFARALAAGGPARTRRPRQPFAQGRPPGPIRPSGRRSPRRSGRGRKASARRWPRFELMTLTSRLGFAEGRAEERAVFVQLRASTEAKALRRLFTAEREAGRLPELEGVTPRPVSRVGIVGAGLMGCGIAYALSRPGSPRPSPRRTTMRWSAAKRAWRNSWTAQP